MAAIEHLQRRFCQRGCRRAHPQAPLDLNVAPGKHHKWWGETLDVASRVRPIQDLQGGQVKIALSSLREKHLCGDRPGKSPIAKKSGFAGQAISKHRPSAEKGRAGAGKACRGSHTGLGHRPLEKG